MKRILFINNNLQYSDGVAICLKNLVNVLADDYQIDILNLYTHDKRFAADISPKVKIYDYFGFYFKGLRSITNAFLLGLVSRCRLLRKVKYDIIVSYQYGAPSNLISYIKKHGIQPQAKTVGVIHTFSTLQLPFYDRLDAILSISEDGRLDTLKSIPDYKGRVVHLRNIYDIDRIISKSEAAVPSIIEKLKQRGKKIYITETTES